MLVPRDYRLGRQRLLSLLEGLDNDDAPAVSLYFRPGATAAGAELALDGALSGQGSHPEELSRLVSASETGAVIFWGEARRLLIRPPFPSPDGLSASGYDVGPLRALLQRDVTFAIILVRLGTFSIGVCHGEQLIGSKTGTGLVHGRHRKGGQSQRRFERRREKQADEFLDRVCGHAREQFTPHLNAIEYLAYGGARTTIHSLTKACPFLRQFEGRTLPPLLDIPRPRRAVLETAAADVWSSRVTEWVDDVVDTP